MSAAIAVRHLNEWERPQRKHYSKQQEDQVQVEHAPNEAVHDADTIIHKKHYNDPTIFRNPVLEGTFKVEPERPTTGKRTFGTGGSSHSYSFLAQQEGMSGANGLTPIPSAAAPPKSTRRQFARPADHDLILEHVELTSKNTSVTPGQLFTAGNTASRHVPEKRRFNTSLNGNSQVQVESAGSTNFFEMPEEKRRTIVRSTQRNLESDPNIVRFVTPEAEKENLAAKCFPNVMRRKRFDHVPDFTKRPEEAARDPQRKMVEHEVPRAGVPERKKQLQDIMSTAGTALGNSVAGSSSDHWQEVERMQRRGLGNTTTSAGDLFKPSWNFLAHEVPPAQHSQRSESQQSFRNTPSRQSSSQLQQSRAESRQEEYSRPSTACSQYNDRPAGRPTTAVPQGAESRQDRIRRCTGTSINIIAGEVNPQCFQRGHNYHN